MLHGLLWLPLLFIFILLTALGWLERRRQNLFRNWAYGSELCKLDSSGAAFLKDGELTNINRCGLTHFEIPFGLIICLKYEGRIHNIGPLHL